MKRGSVFAEPLFFGGMVGTKVGDWSRILSHTVKELFRSFLYKKSRKPLKTKAFGVVSWRPREDLNLRPHA